jgi:hypothetical protein
MKYGQFGTDDKKKWPWESRVRQDLLKAQKDKDGNQPFITKLLRRAPKSLTRDQIVTFYEGVANSLAKRLDAERQSKRNTDLELGTRARSLEYVKGELQKTRAELSQVQANHDALLALVYVMGSQTTLRTDA